MKNGALPNRSHGCLVRWLRAGLVLLLCVTPTLAWQAEPNEGMEPDVYEGRLIREIILRTPGETDDAGQTTYNDITDPRTRQTVLNNIRSYEGSPLRKATLDEDARRLNRLGLFTTVESYVQLLNDGTVRLIYTLVQRSIIVDIQVTGNRKITDNDIAAVVDLIVGTPIDRFQVDRAARRIEDLYREKGYYFIQVTVDETELEQSGIVVFLIREGERVKVTDIRFEGNKSFEDKELRREVKTRTAALIFRKGQLDDEVLDNDIANLIQFYRDRGHLDVRADRLITPSPNGKEAIVTYIIEEGQVYTLRDVVFEVLDSAEEQPQFSPEQIAGLIDIKPGDVYGVRTLRESVDKVRLAYEKLGYVDVNVGRVEKRDTTQPVVDLIIRVSEGGRYLMGEHIIHGNEITKSKVLRRQIEPRPERPLDKTALDASERRIRQTRLFDPRSVKVTIQNPDQYEPEYRDVLFEVDETNTGEFDLGGAISSDSGFIGRISLIQRNFDIADTPDSIGELFRGRAFRGAGQTFRLELQPGNEVQTYTLSISEPYFLESNYSLTGQVFYRSRDFNEYDETRFGFRAASGRRFGTRWSGAVNLRAESVELDDIPDDAPTDVFDSAERATLVGVQLAFSRNTLDSRFRPTRGAYTRVGVEQVMGDFNFTKVDLEHTVYIALSEDYLNRKTVLQLSGRIGYIPQGQSSTPTYERYYLGGQSFRGFDFRTVSPKGIGAMSGLPTEDPVGGTYLFFLGAEIEQPIFEETVAIVGFIDSGTVTEEAGFEDYRVSVGFGFRVYVAQLSPAPLAFDFGFPILDAEGDERRMFTFSVDVPF